MLLQYPLMEITLAVDQSPLPELPDRFGGSDTALIHPDQSLPTSTATTKKEIIGSDFQRLAP